MSYALKDAELKKTRALPSAASQTVDGAAIDLGHGSFGDFVAPAELKISAPAVTTTMLPNAATLTYSTIHSDNADLSSPSVLHSAALTQTGAGGVGAAADSVVVRPPVDVKRYVGLRIVSSATVTDSSSVSATLEALL